MSDQKMELDSETRSEVMDLVRGNDKTNIVGKVLALKPRYLGVYAPGDFNIGTHRLIMPNLRSPKPGRGYHGLREEIILETLHRSQIDKQIADIQELVKVPGGPVAVRHILNFNTGKDEGFRIVWPNQDGLIDEGEEEMADWPRRDQLIKEGKPVMPEMGTAPWVGAVVGINPDAGVGVGMGWGLPMQMAMPFGQLPTLMTGDLSGYPTPVFSSTTSISPVGAFETHPTTQVDQALWSSPERYLAPAE